ncbi:MAG: hypothetical protein JO344_03760 [Planctomycetaceae bacterium]|nr:hypothetical protein [Planctomycetaceae bacterium]
MTIHQILLFSNAANSNELGLTLWAVFKEVEHLYDGHDKRVSFRRSCLAESVPKEVQGEVSLPWETIASTLKDPNQWQQAHGRYTRTFDQQKLLDLALGLIGDPKREDQVVLVTDKEITPPSQWRYIIWSGCKGGTVVSVAPTDPVYWSQTDPNRILTIKHRVRVACCSTVGEKLGLQRCDNPNCFLYKHVDSVSTLDHMLYIGEEHELKELDRRGFAKVDDPTQVQPVMSFNLFEDAE